MNGTIQKRIVLLWTNPNPLAALPAGQHIEFSLDYSHYLMYYFRDISDSESIQLSTIFRQGENVQLIGASGYYNKIYERAYVWTPGIGLTTQEGYLANSTKTTKILVAQAIYGIRE